MNEVKQEVSISVLGSEPTRIKIDLARGILGMSRVDFIKNVIVVTAIKRKKLYDRSEGKFIPIPSNLEEIQREKRKKLYKRFRQTVYISKETYDKLKDFKNMCKPQKSITITDIVESWLDDTVNSLFMLFRNEEGSGVDSIIESVLAVKRGETLADTNKHNFLKELLTGKIMETED